MLFGLLGLLVQLIVLGGLVALVTVAVRRHRASQPEVRFGGPSTPAVTGTPEGPSPSEAAASPLTRSLRAWHDAGLITADQVSAIEAYEQVAVAARPAEAARPARPPRRVPLVAEALGYLGGILGAVGLVLLVVRYWPDMAVGLRVAIPLVAALGLTVAGFLVPRSGEAAIERLRWFVWFVASAAAAVTGGVVAYHAFGARWPVTVILGGAAAAAAHSLALWRNGPRPVQQATGLAALAVTVGTLSAEWLDVGPTGYLVAATGLALLALGVWHRTTHPWLTIGIGSLATVVGTAMGIDLARGPGLLVFVLATSGLLALAAAERPVREFADRTVLAIIGVGASLFAVPNVIVHFGRHAGILTGLLMWAAGLAVLVVARTPLVRMRVTAELLGGAVMVGGAAVTGMQSVAFATIFGLVVAVAFIALSTAPDYVLMSLFGSLGLLVNVPWAIRHFFPGEGRVPLLILVSGALIVAVAVWLSRKGGQLRHEFHGPLRLRHH